MINLNLIEGDTKLIEKFDTSSHRENYHKFVSSLDLIALIS